MKNKPWYCAKNSFLKTLPIYGDLYKNKNLTS